MSGGDSQTRVERLKMLYRDFLATFFVLDRTKNRILEDYDARLDAEKKERIRRRIDIAHL